MPANKRIKRPRVRTARELVVESQPRSAADLKREVHRLEVEIAASHRLGAEHQLRHRDTLPPSDHLRRGRSYAVQQRLTYGQSRLRRARLAMQAAMFLVSASLLAGAAAWLYRFWQEIH